MSLEIHQTTQRDRNVHHIHAFHSTKEREIYAHLLSALQESSAKLQTYKGKYILLLQLATAGMLLGALSTTILISMFL